MNASIQHKRSKIDLIYKFLLLINLSLLPTLFYLTNPSVSRMELEYLTEITALNPSFDGYSEVENRPAFRWVFEDINHPNNFLPVTIINPKYKKALEDFTGWALSFFDTQIQGVNKLKKIVSDKPEVYKKLGTHIAEGMLQKEFGLCESKSDDEGHFNFFKYKKVDLIPHFKVINIPVAEL